MFTILSGPADTQAAAEDALYEAQIPHCALVDADVLLVCEADPADVAEAVADAGWTVRGVRAGQ